MHRCIQIAKSGLGYTRPNPMVGCVIVHNNSIISEGFTSPYGGSHAEVNAIQSVKNKSVLEEATLYVTLEPCSHFGKTPPCSDLIIAHKIPRVVIGCVDDNPKVAGKGIRKLEASGVEVIRGVLEKECKDHHKRFFTYHTKNRPYIILKWAETADGFIAPLQRDEQKPVWITNAASRQLVHKWRAEEQAILIGYNTALEDNPSLTVREWTGQNPKRYVLDKNGSLPKELSIFKNDAKTTVIKETFASSICNRLFEDEVQSVIVEGGTQTLQLFIKEHIWDEARVFTGPHKFNEGVQAPILSTPPRTHMRLEGDQLNIFYND